MNWKLIRQLSMFGLAMGLLTVFLIPSSLEPKLWLPIFLWSAYSIARKGAGQYFMHGLVLGLVNSGWTTAVHLCFFSRYIGSHLAEATMLTSMHAPPKLMMVMTGPVVGVIFGLVLGAFCWVASRLIHPETYKG